MLAASCRRPIMRKLSLLAVVILKTFASAEENGNQGIDSLVEWIRNSGGSVDSRQEVRKGRFKKPRGVFAKDEIEEGALLCSVPWSNIIKPTENVEGNSGKCSTARALAKELSLGEESKFGPFVKILSDLGRPSLPETWSEAGRELLDKVLGKFIAPQDYMRFGKWWREECKGDPAVAPEFDAVLLMVTRAADVALSDEGTASQAAMVPFYDLYNHRNGPSHNTRVEAAVGQEFKVYATRAIKKGEEIYNSYGNSTSEMFRDYGFIETIPQMWKFDFGGGKETEYVMDTGIDGALFPYWVNRPDSKTTAAMEKELKRLIAVEIDNFSWTRKKVKSGELAKEEMDTIWSYHGALMNAIDHTIIVAYGGGPVEAEL